MISRGFQFLTLILIGMSLYSAQSVGQTQSNITYHGRLLKPNDEPLEGLNVQFKIQVRTPNTSNCLLYEETKILNMLGSNGVFSLSLNDGVGSRTDSTGYTLEKIFSNSGSITVTCNSGSETYTPKAGEGRNLVIKFKDETMSTWETLPIQAISHVPLAIEATQVAGYVPENFLRVEDSSGAKEISALTPSSFDELISLISGTSGQYIKNKPEGMLMPVRTSLPTAPVTGQFWFDSSSKYIRYFDGTSIQYISSGKGITALTAGPGLVGGTVTSFGTISLPVLIPSGGTGTKVTFDQYGRITGHTTLTEADLPVISTGGKISGDSITSGTIAGSTAINSSGNITTSGSVTSASSSARSFHAFDSDNSNSVTVTAPAANILTTDTTFTLPPYSLSFPTSTGTNGTTLANDGTGQLHWSTLVSSVAGRTGAVTLTHSDIGGLGGAAVLNVGTTNGTVAAGDDSRFTDSRAPTGSAGGDLSGTYPNPVVAKIQGTAVSSTTPFNGQVIKFNGTQYQASYFSVGDLKKSDGNSQFASANCTAAQTLTYSAVTDTFTCVNVAISNTQVSGLGNSSTLNVGTTSGTVAAGDDSRLSDSRIPTGTASGDLSGTYPSPGVAKIQGQTLGLGTSSVADYLRYDGTKWTNSVLKASDLFGTLPVANLPAFTGDVFSSAGSSAMTLTSTGVLAGTYTRANITVDSKGRISSASNGAAINLATEVSGALDIANGGTNATNKTAAFNNLSPITTKGDLITSNGTNNIRLAAGTTGQILMADPLDPNGIKWSTPVSGVTGTLPIVVSNGSTTPDISINDATTSAKGAVQVGTGISVASGVISADPVNFPAAVPVVKGGTGLSALGSANQVFAMNTSGTGAEFKTVTGGFGITVTPSANTITIAGTGGTVTSVNVGVPSYMNSTGGPVTTSGTISLGFNSQTAKTVFAAPQSGNGAPDFRYLGVADLFDKTGSGPFIVPTGACPDGQTLTFSSVNGNLTCQAYNITSAQVTGGLGFTPITNALPSSQIIVGNASGVATPTTMGGDATISNSGSLTLANTTVTAGSYTRANITVDSKGRITSASNAPAVDLATDMTGVLPIIHGGTGSSTKTIGFNNLSPLTTKGDLLGFNGTDNVRLAIGTDGQMLTADAASANGFKWMTPVSNVTGSAPIVVTNNTTTPQISINDATTTSKGAVQVGPGIAISSGIITADPSNFPSSVPLTKGGTGLASLGNSNQLIGMNNAGTAGEYKTLSGTNGITITHTTNGIAINGSGGSVTSVDVSVPNFMTSTGGPITLNGTINLGMKSQVAKSFLASPQGNAGTPDFRFIGIADVLDKAGTGPFLVPTGACADGQTLTFSSVNGNLTCQAYNVTSAQVTGGLGFTPITNALPSAEILVGNASGVATPTVLSGDATISNTGVLTLAATTVSAGTYTRANITVDGKGRITAAANAPALNLSSEVTGVLPIANGGTNSNNKTSGFNNLSPITTKGDLITSDGFNNVRFAVGTDGQMLMSDSSSPDGIKWMTPVSNVIGTDPIVVTNNTTTPTISINDATTTTKGAVRVGSGIAVAAGIITADPANFPAAVPLTKGGTGLLTKGNSNQILGMNNAGDTAEYKSISGANGITVSNSTGGITITGSGGTLTSVDVAVPSYMTSSGGPLTNSGVITVGFGSQSAKKIFASPQAGAGSPDFRYLGIADILDKSGSGPYMVPTAACPDGQTLTYNSTNGNMTCQAYNVTSSQVTNGLGYTPITNALPAAKILLGNSSNVATPTDLSGDATIDSNGALTLANTAVVAGSYTRANLTVDSKGRIIAASNAPAVNLTSDITGTLPIANGGTNGTTKTIGFNNLSPITAKGDIITSDGTNNVRLSIGTDGQMLTADSTAANGVKWMTPLSEVIGTGPINVSNSKTTPVLSISNATTETKGAVQVGAGIAVSAGVITADPVNFPASVPLLKGGTGLSALGSANQVIAMNMNGDAAEFKTITAGAGITVTPGTNSITITGTGGTITGVTAGTGLTGGGTTGNVTLNLGASGVTAGSYTRANITVDAYGRITTATNSPAVDLTADITGVLPILNGGTGGNNAVDSFNNLSPLTTKGDILARTSTSNVRLGVGTNGQILSADSTVSTGLKWITPVSSVTGTAPIVVTNGSTTPAISINDATTSTKGAMQVGTGLSVSSGVVSADPTTFASSVPLNKGGSGLTSGGTANQILGMTSTGSAAEFKSLVAGGGITIAHSQNAVTISSTGGTVTSVGVTVPSYMTTSGGPVTTSGNITLGFSSQQPTRVFAGPTSGSAAGAPSFRSLNIADIQSTQNGAFFNVTDACADGMTLTYDSADDTISCKSYSILGSQVTTALGYTPVTNALNSGNILVGNGDNVATAVSLSGDASLSNAGALTLANTNVTPGSYTRANITVDSKGRITAAASGSAVNLASEVTGTLPIASGGTGAVTKTAAFDALSPVTARGDLIVFDSANNVRLAAGSNGQVLSADSTDPKGLKWITPVSQVTGSAPITVTNTTTTPVISVSAATTTTKGVVQVGAGIAVNSGTISADPSTFSSSVPLTKGGTGLTSPGAANQILGMSASGTSSEFKTVTGAGGITISHGTNSLTITGSSGTVTQVTSANADIQVDNSFTTPLLTLNTGTSAEQIVKLNAQAQLPAVSGVNLTNLNASALTTGTVAYSLLPVGTTSNTIAAGNDSRFTDSRTPTGAAAGDLSGTYPSPTVAKIQGKAVSSTAPLDGQVYKYNSANSQFEPVYFGVGNLKTSAGAAQFASSCTASQTLTWSAVSDAFSCTNITGLDAAVITTGTISNSRLPASATAWGTVTGGINYAGGNVGIGTATPAAKLDVNGVAKANQIQIIDTSAVEGQSCVDGTIGRDASGNIYMCN